jgi:hypothetical protein
VERPLGSNTKRKLWPIFSFSSSTSTLSHYFGIHYTFLF